MVMKWKVILMMVLLPLNMMGQGVENSENIRLGIVRVFWNGKPVPNECVYVLIQGIGEDKTILGMTDENGVYTCKVPIMDRRCDIVCWVQHWCGGIKYVGFCHIWFLPERGGIVEQRIDLIEDMAES